LFAPEQPDLNWTNPAVHADFEKTLRFWFDRGADGFRIDVAHALVKQPDLPDAVPGQPSPYEDQPGVHEIYRSWRRIADSYTPARIFVGEIWVDTPAQLSRYLRPDELHTAFNFAFLESAFDATAMRTVIDDTLATHASVGAPPTWVLSNHDVTRHVTRYGRKDTAYDGAHRLHGVPVDLDLGVRRGRAAALLTLALPGDVYVYQGDELGLEEVEDIPEALLQDPTWTRSGHTDRGRDGCRVPLPWTGDEPAFGFSSAGRSWLPQPAHWASLAVTAQSSSASSVLSLYRTALALRRSRFTSLPPSVTWLDGFSADVLAFQRGDIACVLNFSAAPVALAGDVLLASGDLDGGLLPPDTCAWITTR
ncbi:MAG TPA: alpha-amylase family glycosyl hydrolase, partial [Micromonosporaceae bacterium]